MRDVQKGGIANNECDEMFFKALLLIREMEKFSTILINTDWRKITSFYGSRYGPNTPMDHTLFFFFFGSLLSLSFNTLWTIVWTPL